MAELALKWVKVEDALPVIKEDWCGAERLMLARSAKYGVLALWLMRGRLDEEDGDALYSGKGDQRLRLNNDHMQCKEKHPNDIIEWTALPS